MPSAGGIRAGRAFVEIGADLSALQKGLGNALNRVKAFGASIKSTGQQLIGVGLAAAAPFGLAVKTYATYEDSLLSLQAAANPTAEELVKIKSAIMEISASTGSGPAEVANAMGELLKAGLPLEAAMGGATEAALQFAKVGQLEVAEAATIMTNAMNVFGGTAAESIDTMSRAADASSISIQDVVMSLAQSSASAKLAELSLEETATAIALLGQAGLKGSDAGTSLKTMFERLKAPTGAAAEEFDRLKLNVRDTDKSMKPMRGIIAELQSKIAGMNKKARDKSLAALFGSDAIRAGAILIGKGVKGWDEFTEKMAEGLTVSEKFDIMMSGLSGTAKRLWTALEVISIEIGEALAPSLQEIGKRLGPIAKAITEFIKNNKELVVTIAKGVAITLAIGAAMFVLGTAISLVTGLVGGIVAAFGAVGAVFGAIGAAIAFIVSPLGLVIAALGVAGYALVKFTDVGSQALEWLGKQFEVLKADAMVAFQGIADALKVGDIELAGEILWAALNVQWIKGINYLKGVWSDFSGVFVDVFSAASFKISSLMTDAWTGIQVGFHQTIKVLQDAWTFFAGFMTKIWNNVLGNLEKDFVRLRSVLTLESTTLELENIDAKTRAKNAAVDKAVGEELGGREKAFQDTLAGLGTENLQQQQALADQQAAEKAERARLAQEALAASTEELAAAQAHLKSLTEKVEPTDQLSEIDANMLDQLWAGQLADIAPKKSLEETLGLTEEGIEEGLGAAKKTIDVKGSFSAAALRGIGIGENVSDRQLEESKAQTKELKKLNDKARTGKLVFE